MSKPTPVFRRIVRYAKPYGLSVLLAVIASLGAAAVDIVMGKLIENMTGGTAISLPQTVSLVFALALLGAACKYAGKAASARFGVGAVRDLRSAVVRKLGNVPVYVAERQPTGDLLSRLTNDTAVLQTFFLQHFANLFYMPVVFLSALTLLLLTSWKLIAASLALLPIGIGITALLSRPIRSYSEQVQQQIGRTNALVQDAIGGMPIIKAFHIHAEFITKYRQAMEEAVRRSLRLERRRAVMAPVSIMLLSTPIILVIAVGGYLIGRGELTAGGIVLFLYLLSFILQPVSMLPILATQIEEVSGAAKRLFEVLDWPEERARESGAGIDPEAAPVELRDVAFAYGDTKPVLQSLELTVYPGENVAIVGASGSGKSTIVKLLCGFHELDPQLDSGQIRLFGKDMQTWDAAELRSRISLVAQESYLFPGTIADNIGFGRLGASREEIIDAAKEAYAHEFIRKLPKGYDTEVSERGATLSGGQRQRIAIARALMKNAPLLLLDEPTSALDAESESLVQAALVRATAGRTSVVIAHRLSTVRRADRIFVLDSGAVAECGTHEQLLRLGGFYSRLYMQRWMDGESGNEEEELYERKRQASLS